VAVTIKHDQAEAYTFLKDHKVGVLATVDPNGEPHAAAIYYFINEDFTISFVTKAGTKKADNLQHNNHAVLVVYEAGSQTTVQVTGEVTEITDLLQVNEIFTQAIYASIETAKSSVPPLAKIKEGDYVGFRLAPKQVRMAAFSHTQSSEHADLFKTFIPG
jgi:general stress protein 26